MKERLLQFLNAHHLTSTKLADNIGVQRSSISHILSGRNKPSYDFIYKFLEHYKEINPKWLILGKDSMYLKEKQTTMSFGEASGNLSTRESHTPTSNQPDDRRGKSHDVEEVSTDESPVIEKIVVFYSDNHFEEYTPRNNK